MIKGTDKYRRPELILSDLIQGHAVGALTGKVGKLWRAAVLAVDLEGGLLQNPFGNGGLGRFSALTGPENPRGAIKARILTDGLDRLLDDNETRVFWPLLPQDQIALPIAPGEHVYVMFEDEGLGHGLWVGRVSGHESSNVFIGADSYSSPSPANAMDSFEAPEDREQRDDAYAGMALPRTAVDAFGD